MLKSILRRLNLGIVLLEKFFLVSLMTGMMVLGFLQVFSPFCIEVSNQLVRGAVDIFVHVGKFARSQSGYLYPVTFFCGSSCETIFSEDSTSGKYFFLGVHQCVFPVYGVYGLETCGLRIQ